ncbi:MAG TPA: hypothetical protein VJ979_00285 [Actinomycetota bacterium]|nr:hypothetical protein [Actinomycetota bacterium]
MAGHSLEAAADRAGVEPAEIARLTELGILAPRSRRRVQRRVELYSATARSGERS